MDTNTIPKIMEQLQKLPAEKLTVVYDFVSYLAERQLDQAKLLAGSETYATMLASESTLRKDWDRSEEDTAWENL